VMVLFLVLVEVWLIVLCAVFVYVLRDSIACFYS
jgi:hypothetical protein